ncbi:hypothetical protein D1F64_11425 [Breoghania sp. L-A4]|nr:hypothetical protein D1F64_11425 [Breoghania sp. L-A4]
MTLRELAIATAAALIVFFGGVQLITGVTADNGIGAIPAAAQKMDRLPLGGNVTCSGQAWGAWSEECLNAIGQTRGARSNGLRVIAIETVEIRDEARNTSTLVRQPTDS